MVWGRSAPPQPPPQAPPQQQQQHVPPPKPKHRFELTSGSECLLKGAGPAKVADRFVKMLAAEADRALKRQQERLDATPPPAPGSPFPDPEDYRVHTEDLLPGLRMWELVFDDASEVIKTAVVPRDEVLELADADYAPTARALKRWNDEGIMVQLEELVMGAATNAREAGGGQAGGLPGTRVELNAKMDAAFEAYNNRDKGRRSTNMSALKPLGLDMRF